MLPLASIAVVWKPNENTLEERTRPFPGMQMMLRDVPQVIHSSIHPLPSSIRTLPWTKPRPVDGQILVCGVTFPSGRWHREPAWSFYPWSVIVTFQAQAALWKPWLVFLEQVVVSMRPLFPATRGGTCGCPVCFSLPWSVRWVLWMLLESMYSRVTGLSLLHPVSFGLSLLLLSWFILSVWGGLLLLLPSISSSCPSLHMMTLC